MGERKPISKKLRFEVFKRDNFTCQYCGRMAPDVVLEVDHIKPVSQCGNNGILNLITSCRDCNRGKGKERISENLALKKQQDQITELHEKREQLEMLIKYKEELEQMEWRMAHYLADHIHVLSGIEPSDYGEYELRKLVQQFSFDEVFKAIDISYARYFKNDDKSWEHAFSKLGGICYNRRQNAKHKEGC